MSDEVSGLSNIERWDEHDPEVTSAAIALAAYHGDAEEDADDWTAAAKVALDATNYKGTVDTLRAVDALLEPFDADDPGAIGQARERIHAALTAAGQPESRGAADENREKGTNDGR